MFFPFSPKKTRTKNKKKNLKNTYIVQVGDTILYIQSVVPDCMTVLIQEYMACKARNCTWQKIEATLFMFRSIAETVTILNSVIVLE